MKRIRFAVYALCLSASVFLFSGCAILKLPFNILNLVLDIASKLPKPPPGVFF